MRNNCPTSQQKAVTGLQWGKSVNLKNSFTNMALGGIDSQEVGLYAKNSNNNG